MDTKYRILMIEDSQIFHKIISIMLRSNEMFTFEIDWKETLTDGIEALSQPDAHYDTILLDLELPDSQGTHTLEKLVSYQFNVPIIVVSGAGKEQILVQTVQLGAQDFLPKDQLNKLLLVKSILYSIEKRKLQKEIEAQNESIRSREKKFRTIAQSSSDGIVVVDSSLHILFLNSAALKMMHFDKGAVIGQKFGFDFDDQGPFEVEIPNDDGTRAIMEMKSSVTSWNSTDDRLITIRDITSRKKTEQALEENLTFVNELLESIPNPVYFKNVQGYYIGCNKHFEQIAGMPREEIIGKTVFDILEFKKASFLAQKDQELLKNPGKQVFETILTDKLGIMRHVMFIKATFKRKGSEIGGIISMIIDISERVQNQEKFFTIFHGNPDPIVISNYHNGEIAEANEAFMAMMGYSREELIGNKLDAIGFWADQNDRNEIFNDLENTKRIRSKKILLQDKDNNMRQVLSSIDIINFGYEPHLIIICKDITEQKKLEDQLFHAQKMESVGRLAAGIAHEINTPIQYVHDNIDFLNESFESFVELINQLNAHIETQPQEGVSEGLRQLQAMQEEKDIQFLIDEIPESIKQSMEGIDRVTRIVRAMKNFTHPGIENKVALNINNAIESTITVARNEWKYVAEIVTDFNPDIPRILCYEGDMKQVILNLIVNAAHAVGEKKKTYGFANSKGTIEIKTDFNEDSAFIVISDNGSGIPDKAQSHIFEPFFTTKEVGIGTGQGLAIVYNIIVKKHRGKISFESKVGEGTRFVIELPVSGD